MFLRLQFIVIYFTSYLYGDINLSYMISRIPIYILFISLASAQYTRVKCPFDATYIHKTSEYKIDSESGKILWKYQCGGLTKHPFFVHHSKTVEATGSPSLAENLLRSLPKPGKNATLREIALYNRILILLTWLDLENSPD